MKTCAFAVLALVMGSVVAVAEPKVSSSLKHYKVKGTTVDQIRDYMNTKGPRGFWAYTEWYVKWTGACKVSVSVKYTLPKLASPGKVPADVRQKFDAMYAALKAHEENHGAYGISAAREIEKAGCTNGDAIIKKYNKAEVDYDKRTDHGFTEGVRF